MSWAVTAPPSLNRVQSRLELPVFSSWVWVTCGVEGALVS